MRPGHDIILRYWRVFNSSNTTLMIYDENLIHGVYSYLPVQAESEVTDYGKTSLKEPLWNCTLNLWANGIRFTVSLWLPLNSPEGLPSVSTSPHSSVSSKSVLAGGGKTAALSATRHSLHTSCCAVRPEHVRCGSTQIQCPVLDV